MKITPYVLLILAAGCVTHPTQAPIVAGFSITGSIAECPPTESNRVATTSQWYQVALCLLEHYADGTSQCVRHVRVTMLANTTARLDRDGEYGGFDTGKQEWCWPKTRSTGTLSVSNAGGCAFGLVDLAVSRGKYLEPQPQDPCWYLRAVLAKAEPEHGSNTVQEGTARKLADPQH
jgi:hypothetical protein